MPGNKALKTPQAQLNVLQQTTINDHRIIPAASELEKIAKIYPDGPAKIIDMAIAQSQHRMSLENKVIDAGVKRSTRAQWMTFIIGFFVIGGGFLLMALGKSGLGIAAVITAAASLLTVFISGAVIQRKERENKRKR